MKVLVTGANGQVGSELACSLTVLGDVVALGRQECDLLHPDRFARIFNSIRPDVIVNAAAYTAVDEAEDDHAQAMIVNGLAAGALARAARRAGALFVHYSSDYVFDGSKDGPYTEEDVPRPLNVYGCSKLNGDRAVMEAGGAWLILRTSWVYSATRGRNVLRTILRVLRERQELQIVASHIGTPTSRCEEIDLDRVFAQLRERDELRIDGERIGAPTAAAEIAEATAVIIEAAMRERRQHRFESGLFHMTASGATTWYGFAKAAMESVMRHGLAAAGPAPRLIPVVDDDGRAMLPRNTLLACNRLRRRFGITLPHWRESLALCLDEEALAFEPA